MNDITRILSAIEHGDPQASEELLPLVYGELRRLAKQRLAHEKPGQTLQATALVHEAYLRLVGGQEAQRWDNRGHFLAAAAEAMRRILIENARRKRTEKHGGRLERQDLDGIDIEAPATSEILLALEWVRQESKPMAGEPELNAYRFLFGQASDGSYRGLQVTQSKGGSSWGQVADHWMDYDTAAERFGRLEML